MKRLCKFEEDLEDIFFIILPLEKHIKMFFPDVIQHYIRKLLCKFELFWFNTYLKEHF
jgi:hypothetical protein